MASPVFGHRGRVQVSDDKQNPKQKTMKQVAAAYGSAQRPGIERSSSGANIDDRARLLAEAVATYHQKRVVLDELDEASRRKLEALAAKVFSTEPED
jgi:hypothetical protein